VATSAGGRNRDGGRDTGRRRERPLDGGGGGLGRASGGVHHHDQRPVHAGAETGRQQVVRPGAGFAAGVVAGVGEAEAHVENRDAERAQGEKRQQDRRPGTTGHRVTPAAPQLALLAGLAVTAGRFLGTAGHGTFQARAEQAEQGGQQNESGQHGDQNRDGERHRHALQRAETEQDQPEQRDDHRGSGEEDGTPSGVRGDPRRGDPVGTVGQFTAEPGEHQQCVVDADTEADEDHERCREVGDRGDMRREGDQADRGADGEHGDDDRQAGGE
jgi:hypothetical protein